FRAGDKLIRCSLLVAEVGSLLPSPPVLRGRGQGEGERHATRGLPVPARFLVLPSPSPPTPLPRNTGGEGSRMRHTIWDVCRPSRDQPDNSLPPPAAGASLT